MIDKTLIPKGHYCYDAKKYCPYWRRDDRIKADFYGFGYQSSVWCDYLSLNSAVLHFEGIAEENGAKCWTAHLLNDMCKICGENEEDDEL